jgi:hypothetical protein
MRSTLEESMIQKLNSSDILKMGPACTTLWKWVSLLRLTLAFVKPSMLMGVPVTTIWLVLRVAVGGEDGVILQVRGWARC